MFESGRSSHNHQNPSFRFVSFGKFTDAIHLLLSSLRFLEKLRIPNDRLRGMENALFLDYSKLWNGMLFISSITMVTTISLAQDSFSF